MGYEIFNRANRYERATTHETDEDFILRCLRTQDDGFGLSPYEHNRLIRLLDRGLVGMDGFRYMWPEEAKENRRRVLASLNKIHA